MNTEIRKPSAQFYPILIGVAFIAAFILSPTSDFLSLIFAILITITGSLLVGFAISRWSPLPLHEPKNSIITALIVGIAASTLFFQAARYFPLLF